MLEIQVIRCPECGSTTKTLSTRTRDDGLKRRRHECRNGHRFTTLSSVENMAISPSLNKDKAIEQLKILEPRRKRPKRLSVTNVPASSIFDAALFIKRASDE